MKSLYRNLSIYGVGNVLSKGINILLVPVYTAYLSMDSFGALELINMTASISLMFFCFNASSGYIRKYYDEESKGSAFSSVFWFSLISSLLMTLLFLNSSVFFSRYIFDFQNGDYLFRLIIIATAIHAVSVNLYSHLQVRGNAFIYMLISIITLVSTICLTVIFVAVRKAGLEGIMYAKIMGSLLEFTMLFLVCRKSIILKFSRAFISDVLKFSIPLIPGQISAFFLNYADRVFIKEYKGLADVGIYSLGYKISSILLILTVFPITKAFGPYIFSLIKYPDQLRETFRRFMRYYILFSLSMALILSLFSREIILLLANRDYMDASYIVYILCMSYVFYGLHAITSFVFHITKKTWIMSVIMAAAALLNIGLNFLLVPNYGIIGASAATMMSFFLVLIIKFIIIEFTYPMDFGYFLYFAIFGASGLLYYASYYASVYAVHGIIPGIAMKIMILVLFFTLAVYSGFISRSELSSFRIFFLNYIKRYFRGMKKD